MAKSSLDLLKGVSEKFAERSGMCPDRTFEKLEFALNDEGAKLVPDVL